MMQLCSVNTGHIQCYDSWRKGAKSALHKTPINTSVFVETLGLQGDEQADLKHHGGKDKAVFILPAQHYQRLQIEQPFGFLGENLTFSDIDETQVCLGDRFQINDVLLEVTQPRSPCWKLGEQASTQANWKASTFLQAYAKEGFVGFYCRVIQTGSLQTGQAITWLPDQHNSETDSNRLSIQALFLAKQQHKTSQQKQLLKTAIKHPALSHAWKIEIERLLSSL